MNMTTLAAWLQFVGAAIGALYVIASGLASLLPTGKVQAWFAWVATDLLAAQRALILTPTPAVKSAPRIPPFNLLFLLVIPCALLIGPSSCGLFPAPLTPQGVAIEVAALSQCETEIKSIVLAVPGRTPAQQAQIAYDFAIVDASIKVLTDFSNGYTDLSALNLSKALDDGKTAILDVAALVKTIQAGPQVDAGADGSPNTGGVGTSPGDLNARLAALEAKVKSIK